MMEKYFALQSAKRDRGVPLKDCRPEHDYQTGVCTDYTEKARDNEWLVKKMTPENRPLSKFPPEFDAKWRFFWNIGERPEDMKAAPKTIPAEFPEWEGKMDNWGSMMKDGCFLAAEMAAIGMGLPKEAFTDKMNMGPHLLAPTGSDLDKHAKGTVFAGFHYDFNFLTIHGRSRYPGLYIWLRNLEKVAVKVPEGCVLLQSGAMFERLTGGYVLSGFHEVVYTDLTQTVVDKVKAEIEAGTTTRTLWRVSSTFFSHIRYDVDLAPMKELDHLYEADQVKQKYDNISALAYTREELEAINLANHSAH